MKRLFNLENTLRPIFWGSFFCGIVTPLYAADTATPIKHVIVVVGENHTFDNVFGGYRPSAGQYVDNLLSKRIIRLDGTPGPNYAMSMQHTADPNGVYSLDPARTGAYDHLQRPDTTYAEGQPQGVPDTRFPANLANGVFHSRVMFPTMPIPAIPCIVFFKCGSR